MHNQVAACYKPLPKATHIEWQIIKKTICVQHHLRVMELAVQKQWPCVLEYDMLVRAAVWEGLVD